MSKISAISTPSAPHAIGPYVQASVVGPFIYTSGQIPLLPTGEMCAGGISEQTIQVLKNLENVLKAGGSDLAHVIKTTVYLIDMSHFAAMNEIYAGFFGTHKPARSTVAVKALPKDALIEIECVALKVKNS